MYGIQKPKRMDFIGPVDTRDCVEGVEGVLEGGTLSRKRSLLVERELTEEGKMDICGSWKGINIFVYLFCGGEKDVRTLKEMMRK